MRSASIPALLLILPSSGQAQEKKVPPPARKEAPETKITWEGEWKLVPEDSDSVDALIDEHLKELNLAKRLWWKRKLQAACKAHPSLDILAGESFSITLGKEVPADAALDGARSEWKRSDGEKFQVSMKREDPRLTLALQGDGYTLTYALSMRKNGRTLAMQTTYAHPGLEAPFSYKLVFQREE